LAIFLLLSFLLSLSPVQTKIASLVTDAVNKDKETHIYISKVDLSVFGKVAFQDILINDYKLDTLFYVSNVRGNMDKLDLVTGKFKIDDLFLINPYLAVKIYENDTISNLDIFINKFKVVDDTLKRESTYGFNSTGVNIKNLTFEYDDYRPKKRQTFDITNLDLVVSHITVNPENIKFFVDELKFDVSNKFELNSLTGYFVYSPTYTQVRNLEIVSKYSKIKSNLIISYPSFDYVVKKSSEVKLDFSISPSKVSLKELNYFVPFTNSDEDITLSMKAKGNIDRLLVSEFKLKSANNSEILANMDLHNILSKNNFDFNLNLQRLSSNYYDLIDLLPEKIEKTIPPFVEKLGNFYLVGNINFKKKYLNSNLEFDTEIGELHSNIEIKIDDTIEDASYVGEVKVNDFDLKRFLDNDKLGIAELQLKLKGKGLTLENLDSYIDGHVASLEFNNYEYNDIVVKGDVKDKLFKGNLNVSDENLKISFDGLIDLRSRVPEYKFNAYIDNADLVKTNLFTRDSLAFLEGDVNIDIKGESVEDLVGTIGLRNLVYQNENDLYYFDEFNVISKKDSTHHKIEITSSDIISGVIDGNFNFYDIPLVFKNAIGSIFNNYKRIDVKGQQNMNFDIVFRDKIIEIFYPNINFKSGTKVNGSIDSESNHLKLKFNSDGVRLNNTTIDSITFWVDNKSDFYNTLLKVSKIETDSYSIHNLNMAIIDEVDSLGMSLEFYGGDSLTEKYNFNLYQTIDDRSNVVVGFLNSKVDFFDNEWVINPENTKNSKMIYHPDTEEVELDSINIVNGNQSILVYGNKYKSMQKYFAKINNVSIEELIRADSKYKIRGLMNAEISVEIDGKVIKPVANLSIDSLIFNKNHFGDLKVGMSSAKNNEVYKTNIGIVRNKVKTLDANGIIDLSGEKTNVDIDANLKKLKLNFINVFTEDLFSDIRGYASGDIKISGPLNNLDLDGYLDLQRAGIAIDYLKVNYNIEGEQRVLVNDHVISVPSLVLRDSDNGTMGLLSGTITDRENYKKWDLELNVKADNLLVLNTTEDDNSLYYGKVFATGNINIVGPASKLNFDVLARTEKGTVFSIPMESSKEATQSSFIYFLPPSEMLSKDEFEEIKTKNVEAFEENLFKGLQLSLNLEVTQDALIEIVFDQQVGDVMKATGDGVLKMDIDTKQGFSMYGTYTIADGEYLFTMQNLINKKFKISRGSTIKWDGDPLAANIDIDAIYKTKTQVASYLDYGTNDNYNKLLVELHLQLENSLLKPDIGFDIKMPDAESSLQSQLEMKLNESEEERSRQFIMLITLNSFASADSDIALGGSIANSTAEMFANQFANVASGISDNFDISLGYNAANPSTSIDNVRDANDELEVGVSSKLFDDRVTVNGNVGVPVGSSQTSIVGDVEVLINLTKDGRYKGKMFTRQNVVTDLFESDGYTQGIGISYQTDFDTFREFINSLFKTKTKKEKESIVPETTILNDTTKVVPNK
jgi:hypothetical protein